MVPPDPAEARGALVGRASELSRLRAGLERSSGGAGGSWLVTGPGGMGKTRVLSELERVAVERGFEVSWGMGLKDSVTPFFLFHQALRPRDRETAPTAEDEGAEGTAASSGPYHLFEEPRPEKFRRALKDSSGGTGVLYVARRGTPRGGPGGREEPAPEGCSTISLSRAEGGEDPGRLSPTDLESLAERAERHFHAHPKAVVAIEGLDYLVSQNTFSSVLGLVRLLRDLAEGSEGRLMVALHPGAFSGRELSLLESEAEVVRTGGGGAPTSGEPVGPSGGMQPPSVTLLEFLRTLEARASVRPQLLLLDDLHWADPQSGVAFQFLGRNARGLRVMMVAGARAEELHRTSPDGSPTVGGRVEELQKEGLLERVPLGPFGETEALSLASETLGAPLLLDEGSPMLQELVRRAEGNPYFLREIFRMLANQGGLERGPEGYRFSRDPSAQRSVLSAVPESLERLIVQRFDRLRSEERAFLEVASVAGPEFDLSPVTDVLGWPLPKVEEVARSLSEEHQLLDRVGAEGGGRWTFTHPLAWEVTSSRGGPERKRSIATQMLQWWSERRPGDADTLARLGHASHDLALGLPPVRRALDRSLSAMQPEAASTYLEWSRALRRGSSSPHDPALLSAELRSASRLVRAGGPRQARAFTQEILGEELPRDVRWDARIVLARATSPHNVEESIQILSELRAEFPSASPPAPARSRHAVEVLLAGHQVQKAQPEKVLEMLAPLKDLPREELDPEMRGYAIDYSALAYHDLGRPVEGLAAVEELLREAKDDDLLLSHAYSLRGVIEFARGHVDVAVREMLKAAGYARRAGNLANAGVFDYNAAFAMVDQGRDNEAEGIARNLLDVGGKLDMPRLRCCGDYLLSRVALQRGDPTTGLEWAERSLAEAEGMRRTDDIVECKVLVAEAKWRTGALNEAISDLETLDHDGAFDIMLNQVSFLPLLVRLLDRRGDRIRCHAQAERAYRAACSLGNEQVEKEMREVLERLRSAPASEPEGGAPGPAPEGG